MISEQYSIVHNILTVAAKKDCPTILFSLVKKKPWTHCTSVANIMTHKLKRSHCTVLNNIILLFLFLQLYYIINFLVYFSRRKIYIFAVQSLHHDDSQVSAAVKTCISAFSNKKPKLLSLVRTGFTTFYVHKNKTKYFKF